MVSANTALNRTCFVVAYEIPSADQRREKLERDLLETIAQMAMVIESQNLRINTLEALAGYRRVQRQQQHLLRAKDIAKAQQKVAADALGGESEVQS